MPVRGGHSLPDALRLRLERSFGADLSGVRVHRCASARRITEALGTRACAVDGAILLDGEAPAEVLAHEVVHLLQARLRGAAPIAEAEREARHLGPRALAGLPCRITVAADGSQPLCWEEAGHYYTIYYTALACGLADDDAMRIAFWAQFPDEVSELDAVRAGFDAPGSAVGDLADKVVAGFEAIPNAFNNAYIEANNWIMSRAFGEGSPFSGYGRMNRIPNREPSKNLDANLDVQRGLHCLTGANWNVETARREKISLAADLSGGFFEFGFSLHPLGDSYAHRDHDTGRMYPPFLGHGPETKFVELAGDEVSRIAHQHHPDALTPARATEYREYIARLYSVLIRRFPQIPRRAAPEATAGALGAVVARGANPNNQIAQIRHSASTVLGVAMNNYRPEVQDKVFFKDFFDKPKPVAASRYHVDRGLLLARQWAPD
ncbi:eCIS core domain-containing protein [Roseococcus sp.]|uniref:eCIS core domain-containing protein n=1 Tax=Roseococcus sp. TaxID=2109646 RepID=UPI003BAA3BE3